MSLEAVMNSSLLGFKSLCCLSLALSLTGCTTWKALTFSPDKENSGITKNIIIEVKSWYTIDPNDVCTPESSSYIAGTTAAGIAIIYNVVNNEIDSWVEAQKKTFTKSYTVTSNVLPDPSGMAGKTTLCTLITRKNALDESEIYSALAYRINTDVTLSFSQATLTFARVNKAMAVTDSKGSMISLDTVIYIYTQNKDKGSFSELTNKILSVNGLSLGKKYTTSQNRKGLNEEKLSAYTPYFDSLPMNKPISIVIQITETGSGAEKIDKAGDFYKKASEQVKLILDKNIQ